MDYRERIQELKKPSFKQNTTLPYLGNNYSLVIIKKHTKNGLDLVDGKFEATLRASRLRLRSSKKIYENWLEEKTREVLEEKVKKYSKELGSINKSNSYKES